MTSTLIKAAIGITAGTVAVGSGATFAYLNSDNSKAKEENIHNKNTENIVSLPPAAPAPVKTKSITALLKEKELAILGDDAEGWSANWEKFKQEYETIEPKTEWSFSDWETAKQKGSDDLKVKCNANSEKQVEDEVAPLYKSVVKYCTKQSN